MSDEELDRLSTAPYFRLTPLKEVLAQARLANVYRAALERIVNGDYDNAHDCKAAAKVAREALNTKGA